MQGRNISDIIEAYLKRFWQSRRVLRLSDPKLRSYLIVSHPRLIM